MKESPKIKLKEVMSAMLDVVERGGQEVSQPLGNWIGLDRLSRYSWSNSRRQIRGLTFS